MARIGHPPVLFAEGLAVAMTSRGVWGDQEFDRLAARAMATRRSLEPFPSAFTEQDPERAYAVAGSFVAFLIDRHGIEPLLAFLRGCAGGPQGYEMAFRAAYRTTLARASIDWMAALDRAETPGKRAWYEPETWPELLRRGEAVPAVAGIPPIAMPGPAASVALEPAVAAEPAHSAAGFDVDARASRSVASEPVSPKPSVSGGTMTLPHSLSLRVVALIGVSAFGPRGALALDPARRLADYSLTAWRTADGLPQNTVQDLVLDARRLPVGGHGRGPGALRRRPLRGLRPRQHARDRAQRRSGALRVQGRCSVDRALRWRSRALPGRLVPLRRRTAGASHRDRHRDRGRRGGLAVGRDRRTRSLPPPRRHRRRFHHAGRVSAKTASGSPTSTAPVASGPGRPRACIGWRASVSAESSPRKARARP